MSQTGTLPNFCRIYQSLRITPAMASGLATRIWELEDIISLIDMVSEEAA
jgi:hypothetical protein